MATTETIKIDFVLNGVTTSTKTVAELENHLKLMKKQFGNALIGSDSFKQLQTSISKAEAELKKFRGGLEETKKVSGGLKDMSAGLVAGYAAMAAAMAGVIQYGKETIDMFLRQEDANDMVRDAFGDYAGVINDAANATQKLTKIGNEQYQELAVQAKNFGIANKDVNKTVQDAIGLADLYGAAGANEAQMLEDLIDAQNGKTKGLEAYVKELRGVTDEEERARILNEKIAKGWEQASTAGATFGDQIVMLKNAYGDMQEEIGGQLMAGLIGDPQEMGKAREMLEKFIETLNKTQVISKYLGMMKEQAMMMLEPFENLFKLLGDGNDATDGLTKALDAYFAIVNALQTPIKLFWSYINAITGELLNLKDLINKIIDGSFEWQDVWNILNEAIVDFLEPISELVGMEDEVSKFFGVQRDEMKLTAEEYEKLNVLSGNYVDNIKEQVKKQIELNESAEEAAKLTEEQKKAIEEAEKAYKNYADAIFKVNEEYKISIALGEDELVSLYNLQKGLYDAEKAYASLGGYTDAELKKLSQLKAAYEETAMKINGVKDTIIDLEKELKDLKPIKGIDLISFDPGDIEEEKAEILDFALTLKEKIAVAFKTAEEGADGTNTLLSTILGTTPEQTEDLKNRAIESVQTIASSISQIRQQNMQAEMSELDEKYKKQIEFAGNNEKRKAALEKQYANEKAKLEKEQALKNQRNAIGGLTIDLATSIGKIFSTYAAGIPATLPLIAGMSALAAAQFGAQLAVVKSQKFGRGGILSGPSHLQGGIKTSYGELEGGEAVVNKRTMANPSLASLVSAANIAGGGVPLTNNTSTSIIDYDLLAAKIGNVINDKKVYVVSSDISRQQKVDVNVSSRAKI